MVNNEVNAAVDPRDPLLRIQRLLDPGTDSLLLERTDCGMIAATGAMNPVGAICNNQCQKLKD